MEIKTVLIIDSIILAITSAYFIIGIVMRSAKRKALKREIEDALITDGGHHKQWYLERLAKELNIEITIEYEKGIAP